jgi:hypothetical protein
VTEGQHRSLGWVVTTPPPVPPGNGADEAQARAYGINGVPFSVIDDRYGISGAPPAHAVLQTLNRAWSERPPLTLVTPEDLWVLFHDPATDRGDRPVTRPDRFDGRAGTDQRGGEKPGRARRTS